MSVAGLNMVLGFGIGLSLGLLGGEGFAQVYNVSGGTMSWQQNGLPLERGEPELA